jgi:hypothetical protein
MTLIDAITALEAQPLAGARLPQWPPRRHLWIEDGSLVVGDVHPRYRLVLAMATLKVAELASPHWAVTDESGESKR